VQALVWVVAATALVAAQNPRGRLSGTVVDGNTARPLPFASVAVSTVPPISIEADDAGRFAVELPEEVRSVRLRATKAGYLPGPFGSFGPHDLGGGRSIAVTPGARLDDIRIRLWPEGRIVGRISDERGEPVVGASVLVMSRTYTGVGSRWVSVRGSVKSDDRGLYEIERLAPGEYVIGIRPPPLAGNPPAAAAVTFFPGTDSIDAAGILEINGSELTADVAVAPPLRPGTIAGTLISSAISSAPMNADVVVRLVPIDNSSLPIVAFARTTRTGTGGTFGFTGVAPGRYLVHVCEFPAAEESLFVFGGDFNRTIEGFTGPRPQSYPILAAAPDAPTWVAEVAIDLAPGEHRALEVPLRTGARISGRVVFGGRAAPPAAADLPTVPVVVQPADGMAYLGTDGRPIPFPQTRIEQDGTFRSRGLPPGQYVIGVLPGAEPLAGWHTASITAAGRDVLGDAVELGAGDLRDVVITLVDTPTTLSGSVQSSGRAPAEARVIVFPHAVSQRQQYLARPAPQRIRQVVVNPDGTFSTRLPPGRYLVAAVSAFPRSWMSPAYLATLAARAADVTLRPGGSQQVAVSVQ
jgi:hypothetical protein